MTEKINFPTVQVQSLDKWLADVKSATDDEGCHPIDHTSAAKLAGLMVGFWPSISHWLWYNFYEKDEDPAEIKRIYDTATERGATGKP